MIKTGQAWAGLFVTLDATGAASAADSAPTGTLYVDGVSNAASVTITGSNPYKFAVTLPTLTAGQRVDMYITATIDTIATAGIVASGQADTVLLSDGVTLADDAITASKFDESTAFPLKSADTGATQVARVGADGDTLETLSDQLDTAQTDLDNPSQYKADVSALALKADLQDVEDKIDVIATDTTTEIPATLANLALEATLEEIKGAGWTDQTLVKIVADIVAASSDIANISLLDEIVVGDYTAQDILKILAAVLAGEVSGGGSVSISFKGIDGTSNVVVATVDANGNRSSVTITV